MSGRVARQQLCCSFVAYGERLRASWAKSGEATNDIDVISPYDEPMIVASSQHDGKGPLGELSARDAEILVQSGPDPELDGLAEYAAGRSAARD